MSGLSRQPIDTTYFMSKYHHPKNIEASEGKNPYAIAAISTPYSKTHGLFRQKQVDDEIQRVRAYKKPSTSKVTITISSTNLLKMHHYHHHCLDIQLTSRSGKGRVVWMWNDYETATDERVMKAVIAALDSSWTGGGDDSMQHQQKVSSSSTNNKNNQYKSNEGSSSKAYTSQEKRKRAASAAESRIGNMMNLGGKSSMTQQQKKEVEEVDDNQTKKPRAKQRKEVEVIDLVDSD